MEQSSEQSVQHEEYVQYGGLLTLRAREQLGGRERSSSAKGAKVPLRGVDFGCSSGSSSLVSIHTFATTVA